MESTAAWQVASLLGLLLWIVFSSALNVTRKLRSLIQPWVTHYVTTGTPFVLRIQRVHHTSLDKIFYALSCFVSVPFYTAFLPILFWSGHGKLARQMTLLMAFCDYLGNCMKDLVSAPRPSCPPVKRVTITKEEKENSHEYGLPSSHTLNTVCLSGYLLSYVLSIFSIGNSLVAFAALAVVCFHVGLIGFGRIYLGMHTLIDVVGGLMMGLGILAFWLTVHDHIDNFIVSGQHAFNGVALGIVAGVQQTYHRFHHEHVPRVFTVELTLTKFLARVLVGLPTIVVIKLCSKALAKWILPIMLSAMGFPIRSTGYISALMLDESSSPTDKSSNSNKQPSGGFAQQMLFFSQQDSFDVDTAIRFLQYVGLAWSVVDLVPSLFAHLNL